MNKDTNILIAAEAGITIHTLRDISDALSACLDADGLLLTEDDLGPEFFNLRSGVAGELFQKFINYRVRMAIVLPNPEVYGQRFKELAYEHRTHHLIRFVPSRDEADAWLLS